MWAWVGDQRANVREFKKNPDRSIRFEFTWNKFRGLLGKVPIEVIYEHELLDESPEELWAGNSIGPKWEKRAVFHEFKLVYTVGPGWGEGQW